MHDQNSVPTRHLAAIALLVDDYDTAIDYFTRVLRFTLIEDSPRESGKRWVVVSPGHGGSNLLLAKATNETQHVAIGNQSGGRVFLFLHTSGFDADYAHLQSHGVNFIESPHNEDYGRVVVFEDRYGNRWDLIQPA